MKKKSTKEKIQKKYKNEQKVKKYFLVWHPLTTFFSEVATLHYGASCWGPPGCILASSLGHQVMILFQASAKLGLPLRRLTNMFPRKTHRLYPGLSAPYTYTLFMTPVLSNADSLSLISLYVTFMLAISYPDIYTLVYTYSIVIMSVCTGRWLLDYIW